MAHTWFVRHVGDLPLKCDLLLLVRVEQSLSCVCVCAYVTVRLVYSVVVSFVVVLLALSVITRPQIDLLATVDGRLSAAASNDTRWIGDVDRVDRCVDRVNRHVDRAAGAEALRQVLAARARHAACTQYVNQLYALAVRRVASRCGDRADGRSSGAAERLDVVVRQYAGVTRSAVDDYRQRVAATVSRVASAQARHVARLYDNDWAQFAVALFNHTVDHDDDNDDEDDDDDDDDVAGRRHWLADDVAATLTRRQVEFVSFLDVDVVHETDTWLDQFWRR